MANIGRKGSTDKFYLTGSTYVHNVDSAIIAGDLCELS